MSKFFCVLNADGSVTCVNADQIVSVHDRGGKCRLHLLDGREISLNCGMRTLMRAAGMEPHWLNLRPNSEYGEVYSSLPGSETKGSPPASTGPVEAPSVGSYEGDAQGVIPARHTSAEEIRARVAGSPAPFSAQEARRMSEIKVAHDLMSARERKARVLGPLAAAIGSADQGGGTPAAPSVPESPDKSAPPESPVRSFDNCSAPDAEQLPNRLPDFAPFFDESPEKPQKSVTGKLPAGAPPVHELGWNSQAERSARAAKSSELPNSPESPSSHGLYEPVSANIRRCLRSGEFISFVDIEALLFSADRRIEIQKRELKDQQAKLIAAGKENRELQETLAGYRKATAVPDPNRSPIEPAAVPLMMASLRSAEEKMAAQRESIKHQRRTIEKLEKELAGHRRLAEKAGYSPGEPSPAPVVTEPPGPAEPAPGILDADLPPFRSGEPFSVLADRIERSIKGRHGVSHDRILELIYVAREDFKTYDHDIDRMLSEQNQDDVAPPSLLTSAGEILDFRKDICLAVLSKSHATIPEGLAEYSRKLAEEVMLTKPIS